MSNRSGIATRDALAREDAEWTSLHKGILFDWVEQKLVLDTLDLRPSDIVLDAGCGSGRVTKEIAKRCRKVYACDSSPRCIETLSRTLGDRNVEAFVHDLINPLPDTEPVAKVVSTQAVQHIPSEVGRLKAVRNMVSKLKLGGKCVVTVYNAHNHIVYAGPKEYTLSNGVTYAKYYSQELVSLFQMAGLQDIKVRGSVNFLGYRHLNRGQLYRLFKPVAMLDVLLSKYELSCRTGALLIVSGTKM